jgi:TRAP-type uncharacterized transport system fused permease subunit
MEIIAICVMVGVVVGVLTQTGLGQKFAMIIFSYSQGNLLLALVFTMLVAIVTLFYVQCRKVLAAAS